MLLSNRNISSGVEALESSRSGQHFDLFPSGLPVLDMSRNWFLNTECAAICQNFGRLDYSQNHRISIEWTYVCKETNPWKIFNHLLMPFLVVFVNMTQITLSLFCNVCFCSKCLMIFSSQVFHLDQNLYYLHVCDVINIA